MRTTIGIATLAAVIAMPIAMPSAAVAKSHYYHNGDRVYHARGGHYRHRCGGGNGAVGTIAGGVGGAVLGDAVGGGTLGTVAGGVGGALLGRHLDKKHTRSRNGC